MRMVFLPYKSIEERADKLIKAHESKYGPISAPIPIESIAESTLDLLIEWNRISETPEEIILAGLNLSQKKVVFNEKRKKHYEETDGLYNTVLAHEVGHWVLHANQKDSEAQLQMFGNLKESDFVFRSTGPSGAIRWLLFPRWTRSCDSYHLVPFQVA